MDSEKYSFKVGKFDCVVLKDAVNAYEDPASFLFSNAPQRELRQELKKYEIELDSWREWVSPYLCLLIKTDSRTVLIDSGVGSISPPAEGKLISELEAVGVIPDQIDFVLLTHAHGDHCSGNADSDSKAIFKNARYVMHKAEWDYWTSESTLAQPDNEWMVPVVNKQIKPLRDHFDLIEGDKEIELPGQMLHEYPAHIAKTTGYRIPNDARA